MEIKNLTLIEDIKDELKRYFIISIKKLFDNKKEQINKTDLTIKLVKKEIKLLLDNDDYESYDKIQKLNKELKELELKRFNVNYSKLSLKAMKFYCEKYEDKYTKEDIIFTTNKVCELFVNLNYNQDTFKKFHNESNKKSYAKKIEKTKNRKVMNNSEKATYLAELKRTKAIETIKCCLDILNSNNEKTTANNVKIIIDEQFESCLAIRQIKTYLKDLKK